MKIRYWGWKNRYKGRGLETQDTKTLPTSKRNWEHNSLKMSCSRNHIPLLRMIVASEFCNNNNRKRVAAHNTKMLSLRLDSVVCKMSEIFIVFIIIYWYNFVYRFSGRLNTQTIPYRLVDLKVLLHHSKVD